MFEQLFQWRNMKRYERLKSEVEKCIRRLRLWMPMSEDKDTRIKLLCAETAYELFKDTKLCAHGETVINYWNELKPIFKL